MAVHFVRHSCSSEGRVSGEKTRFVKGANDEKDSRDSGRSVGPRGRRGGGGPERQRQPARHGQRRAGRRAPRGHGHSPKPAGADARSGGNRRGRGISNHQSSSRHVHVDRRTHGVCAFQPRGHPAARRRQLPGSGHSAQAGLTRGNDYRVGRLAHGRSHDLDDLDEHRRPVPEGVAPHRRGLLDRLPADDAGGAVAAAQRWERPPELLRPGRGAPRTRHADGRHDGRQLFGT